VLTYFQHAAVGSAVRVLIDGFDDHSRGLLTVLGETRAAFAEEAQGLSTSLNLLEVLYPNLGWGVHVNRSLCIPRAYPAAVQPVAAGPYGGSAFIPWQCGWNQPAATEGSVSGLQCACCWGQITPTEIYPLQFGSMANPSWLCPRCGCINCGLTSPLSPAAQVMLEVIFVLERDLLCVRRALSTVRAAYRLLITLLLRFLVPHGIAVCQRCFFTHHGTHPPDTDPIHSGLFPEGVFPRPSVA